MASPFSKVNSGLSSINKPSWSVLPTVSGNFTPVNPFGVAVNLEVGFGQGGFGAGGFDTPTTIVPGSSNPIWSTVAVR